LAPILLPGPHDLFQSILNVNWDIFLRLAEEVVAPNVVVMLRPLLVTAIGTRAVVELPTLVLAASGTYLQAKRIVHVFVSPYHPQTNYRIDRYHRSAKEAICLLTYEYPGKLEPETERFVNAYNSVRYREAIGNVAPDDVYCGRGKIIVEQREELKAETLEKRRHSAKTRG